MRNIVKKYGAVGEWATAAEKFADYWTGAGTWQEMPRERRLAFSEAIKPNLFEWDAVMDDTTPVEEWAALLPRATLLAFDPAGVSPTREIAAVLRRSCPDWTFATVLGAGHMAALMRPDVINPLVCALLESFAQNRELVGVEGMAPSAIGERFAHLRHLLPSKRPSDRQQPESLGLAGYRDPLHLLNFVRKDRLL